MARVEKVENNPEKRSKKRKMWVGPLQLFSGIPNKKN